MFLQKMGNVILGHFKYGVLFKKITSNSCRIRHFVYKKL